MLFPTPRYGAEAITKLIGLTGSTTMLKPANPYPVVSEVLDKREMKVFEIPSVDEFLSTKTSSYPYTKSFEACKDEALVCLHTSGTTGFPKPIIWTHDFASSIAGGYYLPTPEGYKRVDQACFGSQIRNLTFFPPFHASGIICAVFFQLFTGTQMVFAPTAPPDQAAAALLQTLDAADENGVIDALALPPPHAEYIAAHKDLLDQVSQRVKTCLFSGGDVLQGAGEALSTKIQTINMLASTELGIVHGLRRTEAEDRNLNDVWYYHLYHPSFNIRFDEVSKTDERTFYEAVIVKNRGKEAWEQPIFKLRKDTNEISLGDLYTPHPHDLEKWKHYGRSDDLLNFITGETFHPGAAERSISAQPGVAEVLMIGTRRPRASLVVRLEENASVEVVWKALEDVNKSSPVWAQVERHMVLTVKEPFPRTAKGTIQRNDVINKYASDLDALYRGWNGS